jgi:DNA (cytosine-5)-methyltransferase 1
VQIVDLYSGIGGFSLAGSWIPDWRTIQFCEIDKFCQRVLSYHFPGVPIHEDIKTLTSEIVKNNKLYNKDEKTIVTGGFPCQPWSLAGKRKGTEDVRNLWPETIAFVKDYKPDWCLFENVYGLVNWDGGVVFEQVCADLENAGYEVQTYLLPACSVNAPHRRDRIWIVAKNTNQDGWGGEQREKEPCVGELRDIGSGDNERIQANNGEVRTAPNNSNPRVKSMQSGENGIYESGTSTNTTSNAKSRQNRKDVEVEGGGETPNEQVVGGQFKTIQYERLDDVSRDITNTKGSSKSGGLYSGQREGESGRCDCKDASYTCNEGLQGSKNEGNIEESKQDRNEQSSGCLRTDWKDFPTVTPLCNRNDGVSFGLVGITFSKWRNESIKCLGNSIVPEVAYQLLKSIDNYENTEI